MTDYWFEDRLKKLFELYASGALNRPRSNDLSQSEESMKIKMAIKGQEKDPQILFSPELPTEGELVHKGKHTYVVMQVYRPFGDEPLHIIHVRSADDGKPCKGVVASDLCVCGEREPLVHTDRGNLCASCIALMITRLSRENEEMYQLLEETRMSRDNAFAGLDEASVEIAKLQMLLKEATTWGVVKHTVPVVHLDPPPEKEKDDILSETTIDTLHELFKNSPLGQMKDIDWRARFVQQVDEAGAAEMDLNELMSMAGQPAFYHVVHRAVDHITTALMTLQEGLGLPDVIEEEAGKPCPFCKKGTVKWDDMGSLMCNECHAVLYNRSPSGVKKEPKEVSNGWYVPHGHGGCHGRPVDGKCENEHCSYRGQLSPSQRKGDVQ